MCKGLFGATEGKVKNLSEENKVVCGTVRHLQNIYENLEYCFSERTETFERKELYRRGLELLYRTSFPEKV
jgi:hypothetical protein